MVFAGNNTGGAAFFFLDKLKGEEGREGGGKERHNKTNQNIEAVQNPSFSTLINAEMSSRASAGARHT